MTPTLRAPAAAASPALRRPQALQEATVLGVRPLSPRAIELRLERPRGFDFPATRVVSLHLGGQHRTFTIASGPARPHLEFATLRGRSPFKDALAALRPGDIVGLRGPYGHFQLEASRPAVMLAGHIGITPFKAMLEHAVDAGLDLRGALLHARPPDDAPYAAEVAELARALPGLRVEAAAQGSLADAARIAALRAEDAVHYVAGAPHEVFAAAGALAQLDVPRERIKVELFAGYP